MTEKKRRKHTQTEYEKQRTAYRKASPRHVVQFEVYGMSENGKRKCFNVSDTLRQLGNRVRGTMVKRIAQMKRTKAYRKRMADYAYCITRMSRVKQDSAEYKALEERRKAVGEEMSKAQAAFKVTW